MRTKPIATPIAAFILCSCGGGIYDAPGASSPIDTTGASTPVTFTETADAAKAASLIASLIVPRGPAFSAAPCATGSATFTPNSSTAYAGDGRRVYNQCVQNQGGGQVIANGVTVDECFATDGSIFTNDLVSAGESSQPLTLEGRTSTSDVIERFYGLTDKTRNGTSTTDSRDGAFNLENLLSHQLLAVAFDNSNPMTLTTTPNGDGSKNVTASGLFGLSDSTRATANCISGQMTVSTPNTPLAVDVGGNFHAGQLHFTSQSGSFGDVTFQSDGSVAASINGGAPQVITKSTLDSFCSVQ